jgi:hypothetical protein
MAQWSLNAHIGYLKRLEAEFMAARVAYMGEQENNFLFWALDAAFNKMKEWAGKVMETYIEIYGLDQAMVDATNIYQDVLEAQKEAEWVAWIAAAAIPAGEAAALPRAVVLKAMKDLKPNQLNTNDTLSMLRSWTRQVRGYMTASSFNILPVVQQRAYILNLIHKDLEARLLSCIMPIEMSNQVVVQVTGEFIKIVHLFARM